MSKKFIALNVFFAFSLVACQPAARQAELPKEEVKKQVLPQVKTSLPGESSDEGTAAARVAEPLTKIEIAQTDAASSLLAFSVVAVVKDKVSTYEVTVTNNGPADSPALNEKMTLSEKSKMFAPLVAVFQGKLAVIEKKPDPAQKLTASVDARFTTVKDSKRLIVKEPAVDDKDSANLFDELIASVKKELAKRAKKTEVAGATSIDTSKDPSICGGLDLAGVWKYSIIDKDKIGNGTDVTSTLASLATKDGTVQYTGTDVSQVYGCFGPVGGPTTETVTYAYDAKTCRIIQNSTKGGLTSYLITEVRALNAADKAKFTLVGLTIQHCMDAVCKTADLTSDAIEMRKEIPSAPTKSGAAK